MRSVLCRSRSAMLRPLPSVAEPHGFDGGADEGCTGAVCAGPGALWKLQSDTHRSICTQGTAQESY